MTNLFRTFFNVVRYWYLPLVVGILFVALGIYIFTVPLATYTALSLLFSISFVSAGLFETFFSIQNRKAIYGWGWYLVSGLLTLATGILLLIYPQLSMAMLPFVVGFTLLFRSLQVLGFSFDLRDWHMLRWGNVAFAGMGGVLLSFLLLLSPVFTSISLIALTALSCISIGIASIFLSLDLRKIKNMPGQLSEELKKKMESLQKEMDEYRSK